jgi:hypothetical protein
VKRERFCKISDVECILLIFKGILYFEVEPLLMALGVSVYIKIEVVLSRIHILSLFKVTTLEK